MYAYSLEQCHFMSLGYEEGSFGPFMGMCFCCFSWSATAADELQPVSNPAELVEGLWIRRRI
jgi:hypothetical protein